MDTQKERKEYDEKVDSFNDTSEFDICEEVFYKAKVDEKEDFNNDLDDENNDNGHYLSDKVIQIIFLFLKILLKMIIFPALILIFCLDKLLKVLAKVISIGLIITVGVSVLVLAYRYYYKSSIEIDEFTKKLIISAIIFTFAIVILIIPPKIHLVYLNIKNFIFHG